MPTLRSLVAIAAVTFASASLADQTVPSSTAPAADPVPKVCQYVVSAEPGTKPYQLCLTRDEWTAKKLADSKDANRQVCHYEETPGTRLRSRKICMTATEWAEQRRLEREAVEKIQQSVCVAGAGC